MKGDDWVTERDVGKALRELGHEVSLLGLYDDLNPLWHRLDHTPPDLVFNLCESLRQQRSFEPHIVGILEASKIPYTGATSLALAICKDKALTKKLLSFHRIKVPRFVTAVRGKRPRGLENLSFPVFVKPLRQEGSDGISQDSFADNEKAAQERIEFVHDNLKSDAIIEEYIEGRELYVGLLGRDRVSIFSPRELFFTKVPDDTPKFATYYAKWNDAYRKRWGIRSGPAKALTPETERKMKQACKIAYRHLRLDGYGRIDLRIKETGEVYLIEVNPNPALSAEEDFAKGAQISGLPYPKLIQKIVKLGLYRR